MRRPRQACQPRSLMILSTLVISAALVCSEAQRASAQTATPTPTITPTPSFEYLNAKTPSGLPDLSQKEEPICGAAAIANTFWEWSAFPPFNGPTSFLFGHTDRNNFATNWSADSNDFVQSMATRIYGPLDQNGKRNGGLGEIAGAVDFAKANGKAFNANTFPNGLSVQATYGYANIKYSTLRAMVRAGVKDPVLLLKWYAAGGTTIKRPAPTPTGGATPASTPTPNKDRYHAVTLTGIDDVTKKIAISNPWGDHSGPGDPNPPVAISYYDVYSLDPAEILSDDILRIPQTGAGNASFVSGFNTATQIATSIRPTGLLVMKKGGCPNVTGSVVDNSGSQTVTDDVANPDSPEVLAHLYVLLDSTVIDVTQAYVAASAWLSVQQPDWQVEVLNPNVGPEAEIFGVPIENDPAVTPDYELDDWTSGAEGLHFFTSSAGVTMGQTVTLGLEMPGSLSHESWSSVYLVANDDRTQVWSGVTMSNALPAASKCQAAKIKLAGKAASCRLGLESKEASKACAKDPFKEAACDQKMADGFTKSESKGNNCLTTLDADAIDAKVDAVVDELDTVLSGPVDPPATASKCQAAKLKAAGKQAACLLGLQSKFAGTGTPAEQSAIQKCIDKFEAAFAKAESSADCGSATGDTSAVEDIVDAFVAAVAAELY